MKQKKSGHGKFKANESKQLFTSVSDETGWKSWTQLYGSDLVQLLLCSKILDIPGNYFRFQRLHKGSTATFYNKKQLTWCRNFFYLSVLFLFSVSASVPQQNLSHGALTHKNPKARCLMQPSCSILPKAQQEQLLPPFLQKDVVPNSVPPFLSFDVFKTLKVSKLLAGTLRLYASLVLE